MGYTLELDDKAPDFSLPATNGKTYSLKDFLDAHFLVVFFTCNHCPYVKNSNEILRTTVEKYKGQNVAFVGISSNSSEHYEEDSFENMKKVMEEKKYPWVYLYDADQTAAQAYGALCTPHFFIFDRRRHLVYTGRAVNHPREPEKITCNDLERSLEECVTEEPVSVHKTNPVGCNIKWKGKDPHWMPPEACDLVKE